MFLCHKKFTDFFYLNNVSPRSSRLLASGRYGHQHTSMLWQLLCLIVLEDTSQKIIIDYWRMAVNKVSYLQENWKIDRFINLLPCCWEYLSFLQNRCLDRSLRYLFTITSIIKFQVLRRGKYTGSCVYTYAKDISLLL